MKYLILAVMLIAITSCGDSKTSQKADLNTKQAAKSKRPRANEKTTNTNINPGFTFKVKHTLLDEKKSVVVRLEKRITQKELQHIAIQIKNSDKKAYKRIYITYYLPYWEEGAGAWATTHFKPTLEVEILGITVKTENELIKLPIIQSKIIGTWLNESWKTRMTIHEEKGQLFLEHHFSNGNNTRYKLKTEKKLKQTIYRQVKGNNFNEYFHIDKDGNLCVSDDESNIIYGYVFNQQ